MDKIKSAVKHSNALSAKMMTGVRNQVLEKVKKFLAVRIEDKNQKLEPLSSGNTHQMSSSPSAENNNVLVSTIYSFYTVHSISITLFCNKIIISVCMNTITLEFLPNEELWHWLEIEAPFYYGKMY